MGDHLRVLCSGAHLVCVTLCASTATGTEKSLCCHRLSEPKRCSLETAGWEERRAEELGHSECVVIKELQAVKTLH